MNKWEWVTFDLEKVLLGGQTFTWDKLSQNEYVGVTQNKAIRLVVESGELFWQTYPDNNDIQFIKEYFRVDYDLSEARAKLQRYPFYKDIDEEYFNVRLLQQPEDLTILTFLLSSNKNIKAIRTSVGYIREHFGDKVDLDGKPVSLFPRTDKLVDLNVETLKPSGIGYRAKYLVETAKLLAEGKILDLENCSEDDLVILPGVGPKVADCILTFGYARDDISPVDVWTKRILVELFGLSDDLRYCEYRQWITDSFGNTSSWVFQILFEWYREKKH